MLTLYGNPLSCSSTISISLEAESSITWGMVNPTKSSRQMAPSPLPLSLIITLASPPLMFCTLKKLKSSGFFFCDVCLSELTLLFRSEKERSGSSIIESRPWFRFGLLGSSLSDNFWKIPDWTLGVVFLTWGLSWGLVVVVWSMRIVWENFREFWD